MSQHIKELTPPLLGPQHIKEKIVCIRSHRERLFRVSHEKIGMLNVGGKKEEIVDLIIFLIGYVGFPSRVNAIKIAQEVFEAQDKAQCTQIAL